MESVPHLSSAQQMLTAPQPTHNHKTIVKLTELALTVKSLTLQALAPALMVLELQELEPMLQDNLTATNKPSSASEPAARTHSVLVLKEPTAWPTDFASTAETALTAKLETLGMETEVKSDNKLSAALMVSALMPAQTTSVETSETLLAQDPHLTVKLTELASDVPLTLVVLPLMVLPTLQGETLSVDQTVFALTHTLVEPLPQPLLITLVANPTSVIMPTTIATLMAHAEHAQPMPSAMRLMVEGSQINHAVIKQQEPVRDVDPTLTALLLQPTVELMAFATIAVHLIATMLAVQVLMDPPKQLNLTKTAIPFLEFA
jgi:hypothetical protein